ncbi:DUF1292 domain-containing protein [Clostridium cochlearium]|uniref:DUF1292 domain-containing protein n=1 Tax=Clostridium cochlearium TaxID=1494 RepID=A0ABY0QMP0_CLOCO|nr:DUF1292 domain-containing protein [Clostridium cochlearium]NSJ92495.1 DUF1292 domain-containing protein [Coprococcus sp. MSK.21.13]SDL29151.1 Protein of unknown function [Clostridium cochlearium]SNV81944.1 Protein of uncharacterised function (DUF1292) [Clostridium cochlearium]STA92975.1 Protein of uncharacterised function (DUF1292) [Clostridium cochlearium]
MDKDKINNCCCGNDEHNHDCGCGCEGEHEHEHEALLVDLEDEEGNVVTCEIVDAFNYKENDYVLAEDPESESIYLFKAVRDSEEGELENLSDEEFEEVRAYYESLQED